MKSTNDKIDKVLPHGSFCDDWHDPDYDCSECNRETKIKHQILELIKETLQECIGEEEEVKGSPFEMSFYTTRNQIRQEALNTLDRLLNE